MKFVNILLILNVYFDYYFVYFKCWISEEEIIGV